MAVIKGPDGRVADVDTENRLTTFSVIQTNAAHLNNEGKVWSVYFTVTPTGVNDFFFYLKNDGTKNLFITDITVSSTVATQLFYRHVSGTAVGGTAIVVTSKNLGSSATPSATIEQGVNITGLTSEGILLFEECSVVDTKFEQIIPDNIIIPQGQAIAFERVEATGAIECVVSLAEFE